MKDTSVHKYIRIPFEKTNEAYTLKDNLVLPTNTVYTDDEIEQMKQTMFDQYIAYMTALNTGV